MDIRNALKEQYHAGLEMLADCVRKCPDDLWTAGAYPRYTWRIAFHTAFFTNVYLVQNESAYQPWPDRTKDVYEEMWANPGDVEPYELPDTAPVASRDEILRFIEFIDSIVDSVVDGLDLDTEDSGVSWYGPFGKLSHEMMTIGHINYHVGQLSELLMARGIDIEWVAKKDRH